MKKTTKSAPTANVSPFAAFASTMQADFKRALQPLCVLRTGWHHAGVRGAWQAFLRAQRQNFPQGLFSLLLLAQGLVLALLLVAVTLDGVLAWAGVTR